MSARRAAVLGSPVGHSLSPVLHRAAHRELGLAGWSYEARETAAADLPALLRDLDGEWAGLSLTMPLKAAVLPLLAATTPLAAAVGAVNTVLPAPGERPAPGARRAWRGDNTDVHGLVAALGEVGVEPPAGPGVERSAVVLGGGATAASAVAALARLGATAPVVLVRDPSRAAGLLEVAARLGSEPVVRAWPRDAVAAAELLAADVVVSTAPAGAADALAALLDPSVGAPTPAGAPRGALLDVVYDPTPTPLVAAWVARGGRATSGLAMLVHQAGEQVRLMAGLDAAAAVPVGAMRAAGEAELARRAAGRPATG